MSSKNLSVDDILSELKAKSSKGITAPTSDMEQVDKIIFDILTKRQEEQLGKDRRDMSLREKKQLEDEIRIQTQNLTEEIEAIKKHNPKFKVTYDEKTNELKSNSTSEIKLAQIKKEQRIKFRDTSEIELSQEIKLKKEQKLKELQKTANEQHIIKDMKNITDHFGRFKMEDASVDEGHAKTDITQQNYREFKDSRNKKVDAFVIDHKKPEKVTADNVGDAPQNTNKPELYNTLSDIPKLEKKHKESPDRDVIKNARLAQTDSIKLREIREGAISAKSKDEDFTGDIAQATEYEYLDMAQTTEVLGKLISTKKTVKISFIALAVLLIPSIALFFLKFHTGVAGGFAVGVGIYTLIHLGVLLTSIIFSTSIFSNAFQSMSERKPDKDILYSLMLVVSLLANVALCISPIKIVQYGVALYTPIVVMLLFVNFFVKLISINKIIKNFNFISNEQEKCGLMKVSDIQLAADMTKGVVEEEPVLVKNVKVNFFNGFLTNSFKADLSDVVSTKMAVYALPAAIVLAVICYLLTKNIYASITVASGTVLMLTGFLGAIFVAFPIHDTAGVVNHFSGMMPEYATIDTYKDTNAVMLNANELFPPSSIALHGIKTFKGGRIDDAIIDAASVVCSAKSVLSGVFMSIINDNEELLRPVDSIIYEDLMGVSAWVDGKRVLIGNRELMINHSIAVPKPEYEDKYRKDGNEVVFLSNGGELCAAFIIGFTQDRLASDIINLLMKNDIAAVVKTIDACVTSDLLAKVYDADPNLFKILPSRLHRGFDTELKPKDKADSMLGNNGSPFGYIVSIVACKKLSYCTKIGSFMYIISGVLGALLLFAMTILKTFGIMGNLQMLIFMAAFAAIYWLYEKNIKL